jgi:hypothetical protein
VEVVAYCNHKNFAFERSAFESSSPSLYRSFEYRFVFLEGFTFARTIMIPVSVFPSLTEKAGRTVVLVPLAVSHANDLYADQEASLWEFMFDGPYDTFESFENSIKSRVESTDKMFWSIVNSQTKKACGMFALMNFEKKHDAVEIGNVLLGHSLRRTRQATEAFFLFMKVRFFIIVVLVVNFIAKFLFIKIVDENG